MLLLEDENKMELQSEFTLIVKDLISNETVQKMKDYKQHYDTSCFEHCRNVAYYSYLICKKYHLDYISAARAGMLHDLFLYNWRVRENGRKGLHAFTHPKTALENASRIFNLNEKEVDIILKHMWPVTIRFPKYAESYVITFVDKYCALQESFNAYKSKTRSKKNVSLCICIFKYVYSFKIKIIL